jgi:hypothetical protein
MQWRLFEFFDNRPYGVDLRQMRIRPPGSSLQRPEQMPPAIFVTELHKRPKPSTIICLSRPGYFPDQQPVSLLAAKQTRNRV